MLLLAVFIQPHTTPTVAAPEPTVIFEATATESPTESPVATGTAVAMESPTVPAAGETSEVAGVQSTVEPTATAVEAVSTEQCGALQEGTYTVGVSQTLSMVSVEATAVSVYPISYLHCLLLATGGHDAVTLASALGDAERDGATHVALVDLWITNGSKNFAQLTLDTALFSAGGQSFAAMGTLGGGAQAVIASGQGRAVTVVGTVTNAIGTSTGPITLTLEGPWLGGEQVAGKYLLHCIKVTGQFARSGCLEEAEYNRTVDHQTR